MISTDKRLNNLLVCVTARDKYFISQFQRIQAGLLLPQGYATEKRRLNLTQNSHLKQCISWGLGGLRTSSFIVSV